MKLIKRFLPEVVSVYVGFPAMWFVYTFDDVWLWENPMITLAFLAFVAALLSACFYRLAERPSMWRHIPIQVACLVVLLLPDSLFNPIFVGIIFLVAAAIVVAVAVPVCIAYEMLYSKRFAKTKPQGSDPHEQHQRPAPS